ncbi:MAG TPA: hypothetical protein VEA59_05890 [Patescibacteria group bacterium]|nr:hypothetical protein [Patescibacteria group bacterium]
MQKKCYNCNKVTEGIYCDDFHTGEIVTTVVVCKTCSKTGRKKQNGHKIWTTAELAKRVRWVLIRAF